MAWSWPGGKPGAEPADKPCEGPCGGAGGDVTYDVEDVRTGAVTTSTGPCPTCGGTGRVPLG